MKNVVLGSIAALCLLTRPGPGGWLSTAGTCVRRTRRSAGTALLERVLSRRGHRRRRRRARCGLRRCRGRQRHERRHRRPGHLRHRSDRLRSSVRHVRARHLRRLRLLGDLQRLLRARPVQRFPRPQEFLVGRRALRPPVEPLHALVRHRRLHPGRVRCEQLGGLLRSRHLQRLLPGRRRREQARLAAGRCAASTASRSSAARPCSTCRASSASTSSPPCTPRAWH